MLRHPPRAAGFLAPPRTARWSTPLALDAQGHARALPSTMLELEASRTAGVDVTLGRPAVMPGYR